jgi:hypothetical protein
MKIAAFRLRRLFQTPPIARKQPAMKRTSQSPVFAPAIGQIDAAMGAGTTDQCRLAIAIPEEHQILSQQTHRHDRPTAIQLLGQGSRLPVPPQQQPGRSLTSGPCQSFILVLAQHAPQAKVVGLSAQATDRKERSP